MKDTRRSLDGKYGKVRFFGMGCWADWNEIDQIVITLNVSFATPRREEIESGP